MTAPGVDEMVTGQGGVRPHWRGILGTLSSLGEDAVAERARRLELAVYEEANAPAWHCDLLPLPLTSSEAAALEAGLIQRADLLERLLADIYGPQDLLEQGRLPPELLYANPDYQRACRAHTQARPTRHLQAYAADLVRGPDRQWTVVGDRTSGCTGIGYARESRRLLARIIPELFRTGEVRQLRPFFEEWQETLLRLGHRADGRPTVVALLTRGPEDPHWADHLALSRDLACALVEARDLTVRSGTLFIKTLQGLQPVDVLLRRVPGSELDPLELPGASGVTGLLDVERAGRVRIANHPGAAVIEAPGFMEVLPTLAGHLLCSSLLLPSADPGIDKLSPSVGPCIGQGQMTAEPIILRMFLMHDGEEWRMMQGGVARVLRTGDAITEAWPEGVVLKDVWVMREESGLIRGPEPALQAALDIRRTATDMPSRVADDFYWLGRYVERLEAQARLARAGLQRRARGAPLPREIAELVTLRRCIDIAGFEPDEPSGSFEDHVLAAMLPQGAIGSGLLQASRLIEALRDRMTVETHGAFNHALRAARSDVSAAISSSPGERLDALVHATAGLQGLATTIAGVAAEGMVRGGGRLFLDLGRRIERATVCSKVLAVVLDQPPARIDGALRMALELCDSTITYRSRYFSVVQAAPVLDLVLADPGNPRALAFQFEATASLVESAGDPELAGLSLGLQRAAEALVRQVQAAAIPALETAIIAKDLAAIGKRVELLSDRITRRFFALLPALQSVGLETA
ncbi:MAG: circularly permuted type 2 ATP-grasp protein [Janthinobacterium lividum]